MGPTMVTITQDRLDELEAAEAKLQALEKNGVDRWDWYDLSMEACREWSQQREAGIDHVGERAAPHPGASPDGEPEETQEPE